MHKYQQFYVIQIISNVYQHTQTIRVIITSVWFQDTATTRNLPAECPPYSERNNPTTRETDQQQPTTGNQQPETASHDTGGQESGNGQSSRPSQSNLNNSVSPCELFANLSSSGEVRCSCSPGSTPNKASRNSGDSNVREGSVKRRSRCPHVKRSKAKTRSCSYKDGYAQTLPIMSRSSSTKDTVNGRQMSTSYHETTGNTSTHLDDDDNRVLPLDIIELNHIKRAVVSKLEVQGSSQGDNCHDDGRYRGNDVVDVSGDYNAATENSVHVSYSSNDLPCVDVINELNNFNDSSITTTGEGSVTLKHNENTDESLVSVCSETGEKRKSGSGFDHKKNDKEIIGSSLHQSSSCGFDNLRSALKTANNEQTFNKRGSSNRHRITESDSDSVTVKDCSSGGEAISSPSSGTRPKVNKRIIYCEPDEEKYSSDGSWKRTDDVGGRNSGVAILKDSLKSTAYLDSCKSKTSPSSENKTLPNSKKYRDLQGNKRKSEVFPKQAYRQSQGDNSIMSRSVCTAAEYGFDLDGTDHSKGNKTAGSFSISNPAGDRIRREKIKRKESPETFRRISTAYDDSNQFKQYGFIDMPNSIENVESQLRTEVTAKNLSSRSRSREKQELNSTSDSSEKRKKRHSSYHSPNIDHKERYRKKESPSPKLRGSAKSKAARASCRKSARGSRLCEGVPVREECEAVV